MKQSVADGDTAGMTYHADPPRPGRGLQELRPADARQADGARFALPHLLDVEADHRRRDDAALRAGQVAARRSDHQARAGAREPESADVGQGRQGRDRRRRQAGADHAEEAADDAPADEPHRRLRLRPGGRRSGQQGLPRRARAGVEGSRRDDEEDRRRSRCSTSRERSGRTRSRSTSRAIWCRSSRARSSATTSRRTSPARSA